MPLYMDMHSIDGGVAVKDVRQAHLADLQAQDQHGVRYLRYWVDEGAGKVFCLVDAPSPDAAALVHELPGIALIVDLGGRGAGRAGAGRAIVLALQRDAVALLFRAGFRLRHGGGGERGAERGGDRERHGELLRHRTSPFSKTPVIGR